MTPAARYRLGPLDGPRQRHTGPVTISTKKVTSTGTVLFNKTALGIGRAHAGATVDVIRQDQRLVIICDNRLIAEAVLKHGSRYQSANPRGRKVSAKS